MANLCPTCACICSVWLDIIDLIFGRQVSGNLLPCRFGRSLLVNKKKSPYDLVVGLKLLFFCWNYSEVGFGRRVANFCPTCACMMYN